MSVLIVDTDDLTSVAMFLVANDWKPHQAFQALADMSIANHLAYIQTYEHRGDCDNIHSPSARYLESRFVTFLGHDSRLTVKAIEDREFVRGNYFNVKQEAQSYCRRAKITRDSARETMWFLWYNQISNGGTEFFDLPTWQAFGAIMSIFLSDPKHSFDAAA